VRFGMLGVENPSLNGCNNPKQPDGGGDAAVGRCDFNPFALPPCRVIKWSGEKILKGGIKNAVETD